MSQIQAEYIDHMGSDLRVANVARVSFDKWKPELDASDEKLIRYLAEHEHTSPFRHVTAAIRVHAPIFLARQLGKHQVGLNWNEASKRYLDTPPEFYYPTAWRKRPDKSIKQGSGEGYILMLRDCDDQFEGMGVGDAYREMFESCSVLYTCMIENGVAPEMARMVLPQSMMTSWVWTGTLQAFHHMYRLRIDSHAQAEAQEFAAALAAIMEWIAPVSWAALTEFQT